uniref:Uncharacterized protein n=1 Tax=Romanomermis culicivorax TaxID=13658 RepID=A0A915J0M3_ROMCU
MDILRGIALIWVLHDRGRIVGSIVPEASLCAFAIVKAVLAAAVEKIQICWAAAPHSADSNWWKAYGCGSHLVIGPCYDDGQNRN